MSKDSLTSIERDVQARRHAKQPFDARYLVFSSEPMHASEDAGEDTLGTMAREVKLRTCLIQAQVQTLQRQVAQALNPAAASDSTRSSTDNAAGTNNGYDDDDDEEDNTTTLLQAEQSRATIDLKLETMQGLNDHCAEVIASQVIDLVIPFTAPPLCAASEDEMISLIQRAYGNSSQLKNTPSAPTSFSGSAGFVESTTRNFEGGSPPGFFAKYLRKVQPFAFNRMVDENEDENNLVDNISLGGPSVLSHDFRARSFSLLECDDTRQDEASAEDNSPESNAQESIPATDEGNCGAGSPMCDDRLSDSALLANDDIDDFAEMDVVRSPVPTNHLKFKSRTPWIPQRPSSTDKDTHDFIRSLTSDPTDSASPERLFYRTDEEPPVNLSFTSPAGPGILEEKTRSTPLVDNKVVELLPAKPKPKAVKQASRFDDHWGSFTVSEAQRYYQSLQVQCNIHSSTTTKRRFKMKTAASLLVTGAPSSTAEALALLRSEQVKRARVLCESREKYSSCRQETFLLGSLDALLARPPQESSLSTTSILSACLFRLCPQPPPTSLLTQADGDTHGNDDTVHGEDGDTFENDDQAQHTVAPTKLLQRPESIIRTAFSEFCTKSKPHEAVCSSLEDSFRSLEDTPIVSVAFIRRALMQQSIVQQPPHSSTIKLDDALLSDLGLVGTTVGRRREIADGRLVFAALLTIAHQFNRAPPESLKHRMVLNSAPIPRSSDRGEGLSCSIRVDYDAFNVECD